MKNKLYNAISSCFLFEGTDINELFTNITADIQSFDRGDVILEPENCQPNLAIILEGKAEVFNCSCEHNTSLNVIPAGGVFGAAALFGGNRNYFTTVKAKTKCTLLFLSEETVVALIKKDFTVSLNYIRFLTSRIGYLNSLINSYTAGSAENRLACYLISKSKNENEFFLSLSYSSLANLLGIGRTSLYRALDLFEKNGIIVRDKNRITIINRDLLLEYKA